MRSVISKSSSDTAEKARDCMVEDMNALPEMVEVIVVTHNSAKHIEACIDSIAVSGGLSVVVDNASTDDTVKIIRSRYPEVRLIETRENLGYGKGLNLGFRGTKSEFVIFSNPDVVFMPESIQRMVNHLRHHPGLAITAPQQMFPDRSWQRSYGDLPGIWSGIRDAAGITSFRNQLRRHFWPRRLDRKPREVPYLDGAVLTVRRKAFLEIGGFDEAFFFYSEEADLCARFRIAGWKVEFLPAAEVIHIRGASSTTAEAPDRFVRYMVESQFLLATKHLPRQRARAYAMLQIGNFSRLGLTYRILQWFSGNDPSVGNRIRIFDAYRKMWKEFSRRPELAYAANQDGDSRQPKRVH